MGHGNCHVERRRLDGITSLYNGPIGGAAEQELKTEADLEITGSPAQVGYGFKPTADNEHSPEHHRSDDNRSYDMRNDTKRIMAERSAEDDLQQNQRRGPDGKFSKLR